MRTLVQAFLVAVLVLVCTASIHAQEALWKELNSKFDMLYQQRRYSEAAKVAQEAMTVAERTFGPNHPNLALSLNDLALAYQEQSRYAEAEALYKRSLEIGKKALDKNHPGSTKGAYLDQNSYADGVSLNYLAILYCDQGRYSQAEILWKRSLTTMEEAFGKNHPYVLAPLKNLAKLYQDQGKYAEAEVLYKRSLKITEEVFGKNHHYVAHFLKNLAGLYQDRGEDSKAKRLYKRSRKTYAKAERISKRLLKEMEEDAGPEALEVMLFCSYMAEVYRNIGKEDEAEKLEARVREIRSKQ